MSRRYTADEMRKASSAIYIALEEPVARELSAMLRQAAAGPPRCKTCPHFYVSHVRGNLGMCEQGAKYFEEQRVVPADGSGYCHQHPDNQDAKETK